MKNILVAGGAGFIGSSFVHYVLEEEPDCRIVNLDALTYAGSLENLVNLPGQDRHTFVKGDIRDGVLLTRLMSDHNIDTVVHFAAESHVDRSIEGPEAFVQTNVAGTLSLLQAARLAWIGPGKSTEGKRFHHMSTDEVFGSLAPDDPPFREDSPYAPSSPYAASKAASDHLVRAYVHTYGLPATIGNCSNNYGPRQFPEKLIPLTILNALAGSPLSVYGDGAQVRDWLFVGDCCEALLCILRHGRPGESYNIGGGNQPTNLDVVERICAHLDKRQAGTARAPHRSLIRFVADRPGHDRRYAVDAGKIKNELGWEPRTSLDRGLQATVDWYIDNPGWLTAIGNREDYRRWVETNYAHRKSET